MESFSPYSKKQAGRYCRFSVSHFARNLKDVELQTIKKLTFNEGKYKIKLEKEL